MLPIRIQSSRVEIDPITLAQAEQAICDCLDRFTHLIRSIDVTILDVNGPKGGVDKNCRIQLRLIPRGLVVVRSSGTTILEAVNIACDRAKQAVSKRASKRKSSVRSNTTHDENIDTAALN